MAQILPLNAASNNSSERRNYNYDTKGIVKGRKQATARRAKIEIIKDEKSSDKFYTYGLNKCDEAKMSNTADETKIYEPGSKPIWVESMGPCCGLVFAAEAVDPKDMTVSKGWVVAIHHASPSTPDPKFVMDDMVDQVERKATALGKISQQVKFLIPGNASGEIFGKSSARDVFQKSMIDFDNNWEELYDTYPRNTAIAFRPHIDRAGNLIIKVAPKLVKEKSEASQQSIDVSNFNLHNTKGKYYEEEEKESYYTKQDKSYYIEEEEPYYPTKELYEQQQRQTANRKGGEGGGGVLRYRANINHRTGTYHCCRRQNPTSNTIRGLRLINDITNRLNSTNVVDNNQEFWC